MAEASNPANLEPNQLIQFLHQQANGCQNTQEKSELFLQMGAISERELGDLKKAVTFYQEGIQLNPQSPRALKALYQTFFKAQQWQEAAKVLRQWIQALETKKISPQAPEYLAALMEEGNLFALRLQREPEATALYRKVLSLQPQYQSAQVALERILWAKKDWAGLAEMLERSIPGLALEEQKLSQIYRLAILQMRGLKDTKRAGESLQALLKIRPGYLPGLKQLEKIYHTQEEWNKLAELYEQMAASIQDRKEGNRFLSQAARVWSERVGNGERAVFCLEKIIKEDAAAWQSLEQLREYYRGNEAYGELKRILLLQLKVAKDANLIRSLRYSLAEVCERSGDVKGAIEHYRFILVDNPRDLPALRVLGSHYGSTKEWQLLADLYENELRATEDPAQVLSIVLRLAMIYERQLRNLEKAMACAERATELWPQNPVLKWDLDRLYTLAKDWKKLVESLRKELQQTGDDKRKATILEQLAEITQHHFHDPDRAADYYQDLLKINPGDVTIYQKLAQLYETNERWTDLTTLLGNQIAQAGNSPQAVSLYLKAAEIFDQKLNQMESALYCYQQAFAIAPHHLPTIHAMGGLLHRLGDFPRLLELLQQEVTLVQDAEQKASLYFRMGEILAKQVSANEQAVACYRYALQLKPGFYLALEALLIIFERQNSWVEWTQLVAEAVESIPNPEYRALRYVQMAQVRLQKLQDLSGAFTDLQQALQTNPQNGEALSLLAELYEQQGKWSELADLLQRFISESQDATWSQALSIKLAEIREVHLQDIPGAIAIWERVLSEDSQNPLAIDALEQIFRHEQNAQGLAKVLNHRLQLWLGSGKAEHAMPILEELADLALRQFKDAPRACACLQKILEISPQRRDVFDRLHLIYSQTNRFQELADLLRTQIRTDSTNSPIGEEAIELYQELAFLYERRLKRIPEAITCWEQIRKVKPQDVLLFKSLERLYLSTRDLKALAELYETFAEPIKVPEEKVRILILAGEIFAGRLQEAERARICFEKAVKTDPKQLKAWEALKTLYEKSSNWSAYLEVNERLFGLFTEEGRAAQERAQILVQNAAIYDEKLQQSDQALKTFRQALELTPKDLDIVRAMIRLHRSLKAWEEVLADYSHWLVQIDDPPQAVAIFQERGQVLDEQLKQPDYAVLHYEKALAIDPLYLPALERLSKIYFEAKDWEKAKEFTERLILCQRDNDKKKNNLIALGDLLKTGFADAEKALARYEEALVIDPRFFAALNRVGDLYEEKKEWEKLTQVLEKTLAQLSADSPDAIPLLMKLGSTLSDHLKQVDRAAAEFKKVLKIDETHVPAQVGLAQLYSKNTDAGYTTQAINEHRRVLEMDPTHFETYRSLAKVFEKTSQYDKVFCLYQILDLMGVATQTERSFLQENQAKVGRDFKQSLLAEDRLRYLIHENGKGAPRDFLLTFGEVLDKVFKGDLTKYNFKKSDRITSQSKNPNRDLCDRVAFALGMTEYDFYMGKESATQNEMVNSEPPSLILSPNILKKVTRDELRFIFGVLIIHLKERFDLVVKMKSGELGMVMRTVRKGYQALAKKAEPNFTPDEEKIFRELDKAISRKNRKEMQDFAEKMRIEGEKFDEGKFRKAMEMTILHAGLVASCDITVALGALSKTDSKMAGINFKDLKAVAERLQDLPFLKGLLLYAASDEYFAIRKRLGVAII